MMFLFVWSASSRVSNLESQVSGLRQKLLEKDRLVHELEDRVSSFERLYHEADSSLKNVVDENVRILLSFVKFGLTWIIKVCLLLNWLNFWIFGLKMKLTQERDSLAITAKKLGRDYAKVLSFQMLWYWFLLKLIIWFQAQALVFCLKLEAFKRQLMQSLNDDNPSVCSLNTILLLTSFYIWNKTKSDVTYSPLVFTANWDCWCQNGSSRQRYCNIISSILSLLVFIVFPFSLCVSLFKSCLFWCYLLCMHCRWEFKWFLLKQWR